MTTQETLSRADKLVSALGMTPHYVDEGRKLMNRIIKLESQLAHCPDTDSEIPVHGKLNKVWETYTSLKIKAERRIKALS